jgi:hypothetical protein
MNPRDFVETIYLGDRGCKGIYLNGWEDKVTVTVDRISRIRDSSGEWNFYSDEDIDDAQIVFTDVKGVQFSPSGPVPNDRINYLEFVKSEEGISTFRFSIDSIKADGTSDEVLLEIQACGIHIEDPKKPNVIIVN